jgi:hypothetical protein
VVCIHTRHMLRMLESGVSLPAHGQVACRTLRPCTPDAKELMRSRIPNLFVIGVVAVLLIFLVFDVWLVV